MLRDVTVGLLILPFWLEETPIQNWPPFSTTTSRRPTTNVLEKGLIQQLELLLERKVTDGKCYVLILRYVKLATPRRSVLQVCKGTAGPRLVH